MIIGGKMEARKAKHTVSFRCSFCSDFKGCKSIPKSGFKDVPSTQKSCYTSAAIWKKNKLTKKPKPTTEKEE